MILKNLEKYIVNPYFAAIALTNDVIEFGVKVWSQKMPVIDTIQSLNWLDIAIKLFLGFLVSRLFKLHKETKDNLEQVKQEYLQQKERLNNQIYIQSLVNVLKINEAVLSRMQFPDSKEAEEYKLNLLQQTLENEKILVKNNLLNLAKHKTVIEIDNMVSDYYQINFKN